MIDEPVPNVGGKPVSVRVLFFGAARDAVGKGDVTLALNRPSSAATALAELLNVFPELQRFGACLLLAVNQEYAEGDREICDGDELAVLPPVSGGSRESSSVGFLPGKGLSES